MNPGFVADGDVAIVGGGPAGSALACRLLADGLRVVLIESSKFDQPRPGESLALNVRGQLEELDLWRAVLASGPVPSYGVRSCWGGEGVVETSHLIHTEGNAWHMNRLRFDAALATAAATRGAVLLTGTRLTDIRPTVGHWELTLDNGARTPTKLRVGFLVEASGRGAGLARRLGARRILFDRLVGVAASQLLLLSVERHLLVEACSDGWWSSAPAGAGQLVTTLMSDSDLIGGAGRDAVAYLRRRSAASLTSARLENSELLWGPRVFSAVSQRLQRSEYQLPWLAVGDAALSLDPLSGRGVTRALTGAACAARAVRAFLDGGGPLVLREYEHELDRACTQYLLERPFFYGGERRWPNAPFWRRRLAVCDRLTAQSAGGARPPNVSAPPSLNPAGETPRYGDPAMSIDA